MRLTINTFDSLAPIWQSSGVLCISHPRAFPRHPFTGPAPSPVFQVPATELTAHLYPLRLIFFLSFWDADQSMSVHGRLVKTVQFRPTGFCALWG
jgi:hypothetical protein